MDANSTTPPTPPPQNSKQQSSPGSKNSAQPAPSAKETQESNNKKVGKADNAPITKKGHFKEDDDGSGKKHNDPNHQPITSGTRDANGNIEPSHSDNDPPLNADKDSYGVVPGDIHKNDHVNVGDKMDENFGNGNVIHTHVGDVGPTAGPPDNVPPGEASIEVGREAGYGTIDDAKDKNGNYVGPVPTKDGKTSPDVPVTVTYYPGTAPKPVWTKPKKE